MQKTKEDQGFTIIEVLIVLAIAGLILLIVLIAVPQLQRNQRNEARRNVLARLSTEINNFSGNNRGDIPGDTGTGANVFNDGFEARYVDGDTAGTHRDTFLRPEGGQFTLNMGDFVAGTTTINETIVHYDAAARCNGETPTATGASPRDFALVVGLEGGASYCVDNGSN